MTQKYLNKKKATLQELQSYTGHLNFLNKAIVPGRTYTRRMYSQFSGENYLNSKGEPFKPFHHIKLGNEFKNDCRMWETFLMNPSAVNRPFIDLNKSLIATELRFFSDASANENLGFGIIFNTSWSFGKWEQGFIRKEKPSIAFLELYALIVGIFCWPEKTAQSRVIVFTDNTSARDMINDMSGRGPNCMKLLRMLTLNNLKYDRRVFAKHIKGSKNNLSDSLSRLKFKKFFREAPTNVNKYPDKLPNELWPLSKIWIKRNQQ